MDTQTTKHKIAELQAKLCKEQFPFSFGNSNGLSRNGDMLNFPCTYIHLPGMVSNDGQRVHVKCPDGSSFTAEVYGDYDSEAQLARAWNQRIYNSQIEYQIRCLEERERGKNDLLKSISDGSHGSS
jgi:hypothetical protein